MRAKINIIIMILKLFVVELYDLIYNIYIYLC